MAETDNLDSTEMVERLRRHYKENVLKSEPAPEFEKLKERLESPGTFKSTVIKGLNRAYCNTGTIHESDIDGSELMETDPDLSLIAIKVPYEKIVPLIEKLGVSGAGGLTMHSFEKNSPFYRNSVMLVTDEKIYMHEKLHVIDKKTSRSKRDIDSMVSEAGGVERWNILSLQAERYLLGEVLAKGMAEGKISASSKHFHPGHYAKYLADILFEKSNCLLPDCGAVSKHGAREIVEKATCSYLHEKYDAAAEVFETLKKYLPEEKLTRLLISCGPTREEIESGNYLRPFEELAAWSKHWKEVLEY